MVMKEPDPPDAPQTANEHAHAFASEVEDVEGVEYARVTRGLYTGSPRAVVSVTEDMDVERMAEIARSHGTTDVEKNGVLNRVTFTFARGLNR